MVMKIVSTVQDFDTLEGAWNELTLDPLRSFAWHRRWWQTYAENWELRVYLCEDAGKLQGVAPFFVDRWLRQDRLRFIGSGNVCSDYAQVIANPDFRASFVCEIIDDIKNHTSIAKVELDSQCDSTGDRSICNQLEESRYWSYERSLGSTWFLELPECWETFANPSSKSMRRKIRQATRRIESGQVIVRSTLQDLELSCGYKTLASLNQEWSVFKNESSVFEDPDFNDFLRNVTHDMAKLGRVEILVAYAEDRPISAQLYWHSDAGPQLYQNGTSPAGRRLEPGHLLFTHAVRNAIENGYRIFDFLRSPQAATPSWNAIPRRLTMTRCVSNRMVPTAINRSFQLLGRLKDLKNGRTRI